MKFSISLIETNSKIRGYILESMKKTLDNTFSRVISSIKQDLQKLVIKALQAEPEYTSLISGELRREFGIADTSNVDTAVKNLAESILITKKNISINNNGLSGGLEISIINNQDYGGALLDFSGQVIDNERGYSLPWLEWLLLKGSAVIIKNYEVKLGSNPRSRSGDAIMIESTSSWRVPPAFAGTINNNWTTRALSNIENELNNLIKSKFESSL